MKRTELTRTVGLARGPARLARTVPLSRGTGMPRQPSQRPRKPPKSGDWSQDTRDAVQRRSGGRCEVGIVGKCTGAATDLHHRQPRRTRQHTAGNALHVCRQDHRWIHEHPAEARASGWILHTSADPAAEPCVVRGRLVWLTGDGKYVGERVP